MKGSKKLNLAGLFVLALVAIIGFASCEKLTDFRTQSEDTEGPVKPDDPVEINPDYVFSYTVDNRGNEADINWVVKDGSDLGLSDKGSARVSCSHEHDKYAAAKDVALAYSLERTSHSDPVTSTKSSSDNRKVFEDAVKTTSQVEDGNIVYSNNADERIEYTLNGKTYKLPYIKIGKKYLKAINRLPGTTNYRTRGDEFVADSVCREFVWGVPYEIIGYEMNGAEIELRDTIRVYQMDVNDIVDAKKVSENRVPISETEERCDVEIEWIMKDGSKHRSTESTILQRKWTAKEEYDKIVKNFLYTWRYNNPWQNGNASQVRTDGNFTISGKTDMFSARLNNDGDLNPVDTDYKFYHEKAEYSNQFGVKANFDFIAPEVAERSTIVNDAEGRNGYTTRRLNNAIGTSYLGYAQDVAESVFLLVENAHITSQGWDKSNCTEDIDDNQVIWNLVYVINWSDGHVERIPFQFKDSRSLNCDTNWSSEEEDKTYSTSNVTVSLSNTENHSEEQKGAKASWVREYYDLQSVVTLLGSTQKNHWTSREANGFKVIYNDNPFSFESRTLSASNADALSAGVENNGYTVYSYSDVLRYVWGSNIKTSTAPGTIKVKVVVPEEETFFPKPWGKLLEVKQTVSNNAKHNGFVYIWSLHFEKGVLPVVVQSYSSPDWNFEYFEYTSDHSYNSGTCVDGVWINTVASDQYTQMTWSRGNTERANQDYMIAMSQNWDEGHMVDGHCSTQTSRYDLKVNDGRLTATDTYSGSYLGSWK